MREFITGNEAIVRAALRAGCNFFAGYPITPASSILRDIIMAFGGGRGIAVQTEDELAAIGQCIGAAMAGARAMTASSGPGLSLYSENIGLAQMGEVPLVIVDCQRMGPATGGATATGEGDVLFARYVTSGGYPLPVLAASDATTAYRLTGVAFAIAERLRTPVILLVSKDISMRRQTVDLDAVAWRRILPRPGCNGRGPFRPYALASSKDIPAFQPIGGSQRVRMTGSIHDADGLLTIDRRSIHRKLEHLRDKIEGHASELEDVDASLRPDARVLIVSYGLADGAAREAVATLRESGVPVSHLTLYSLWPVPQRALKLAVTAAVERVLVPELNIGLYAEVIRHACPDREVVSILRYDGGLIDPDTIVRAASETAGCAARTGEPGR